MEENNTIFKKFANSFINEILPLIKKNHVDITNEFQCKTCEEIAYLFKCKYYSIITPETYRIAVNHVILQDVGDINDWLCDNNLFIYQYDVGIEDECNDIIASFPRQADQYRIGNTNVINFLVGQVMKRSKGKFKADVVKDKLCVLLQKKS